MNSITVTGSNSAMPKLTVTVKLIRLHGNDNDDDGDVDDDVAVFTSVPFDGSFMLCSER